MGRKSIRSILSLFLALLLLSSCGASGGAATDSAASEETNVPAMNEEGGYGYLEDADTEESASSESQASSDAYEKSQVKLIYTAYLELEVLDFDAAIDDLNARIEAAGGYCESSNFHNYSTSRSADYVVRVPSEEYRAFVDACSEGDNCHLLSKSEDVQNVGEEYFDAETRLSTLRTKLERLQALLAQATEMEDIIALESAISETEYQIEQYNTTLNRYDSLIDYATVQIYMQEVLDLTEDEGVGLLTRLGQNLRWGGENFLDGMEELILWLAYNIIDLVLLALVVTAVVLVIKKVRRRKAKKLHRNSQPKQTPPPSEPPAQP